MISKRDNESGTPAKVAVAWGAGRKLSIERQGEESRAVTSGRTKSEDHQLMERVVERSNLWSAYERVVRNKGAAGVDDLPVSELKDWLKVHWLSVKQALLEGRYIPRPVRRVDIPKPQGGVRTLGIPTVIDRLIQQALHQVLGADLLGGELRLPAGQECSSGGAQSAGVHPRRQALGGGHRFGEVLRPGQSRCADVTGGAPCARSSSIR